MTWLCSEATTQSVTNTLNQGMTTARLQRRPSSNKNVESKLQLSQWEENTRQLKNLQGSRQTTLLPRDRGEENLSSQSRPPALPGRAQALQAQSFRVWMSSENGIVLQRQRTCSEKGTQMGHVHETSRTGKSTATEGRRVGMSRETCANRDGALFQVMKMF